MKNEITMFPQTKLFQGFFKGEVKFQDEDKSTDFVERTISVIHIMPNQYDVLVHDETGKVGIICIESMCNMKFINLNQHS